MESVLKQRVTGALGEVVGLELIDVELFCFDYERNEDEIQQPVFAFSGEVILIFSDMSVAITWDENAGWQDHFSLYVGKNSLYLPTSSLVKWNVANLQPWKKAIRKELTAAKVYGFDFNTGSYQMDAPHFVELDFEGHCIFVGEGVSNYPNKPYL